MTLPDLDPAGPWVPGPARPHLEAGEVHVWRARLRAEPCRLDELEVLLSQDEKAKAATFRFAEHRERFVVRRVTRRLLLSRYAGCDASVLSFRESPLGKPALSGLQRAAGLRFNGANSEGLALFAVAQSSEVGLDVERIRPIEEWDLVAARVCSVRELETLRRLPDTEREEAFFRCWTRKEALAKATGHGLSLPLWEIDVSLGPGERTRLVQVPATAPAGGSYVLHQLDPGVGFAGALVVQHFLQRLRLFDFASWQVAS